MSTNEVTAIETSTVEFASPTGRSGAERNEIIDAYRAFLIFGVLFYHYLVRWAPPFNDTNLYGYAHAYPAILSIGKFGVHVFFAISGIVISITLERSKDIMDFAFRRISRLWPGFVAAATITFIAMTVVGPAEFRVSFLDYIKNFTMAAPFVGGKYVDGAYWSLKVEVVFYAWIAIIYLLLKRRFWIGLCVLGFAGWGMEHYSPKIGQGIFLSAYLPFFLFGISIYLGIFNRRYIAAVISAVSGAVLYVLEAGNLTIEFVSPVYVHLFIIGCILSLVVAIRFSPEIPLGPIPYLGRVSYSLYLIHQYVGVTIIHYTQSLLGWSPIFSFGMAVAVCLSVAIALYHLVEIPAQTWLRAGFVAGRARLRSIALAAAEHGGEG